MGENIVLWQWVVEVEGRLVGQPVQLWPAYNAFCRAATS